MSQLYSAWAVSDWWIEGPGLSPANGNSWSQTARGLAARRAVASIPCFCVNVLVLLLWWSVSLSLLSVLACGFILVSPLSESFSLQPAVSS
jgi:glucan phosphoethanolaminetransferase (alkaline phosphatase superfamily)